jgi:multisubunit Na+/H+ antiporter MnhB subunit
MIGMINMVNIVNIVNIIIIGEIAVEIPVTIVEGSCDNSRGS